MAQTERVAGDSPASLVAAGLLSVAAIGYWTWRSWDGHEITWGIAWAVLALVVVYCWRHRHDDRDAAVAEAAASEQLLADQRARDAARRQALLGQIGDGLRQVAERETRERSRSTGISNASGY